MADLGYATLDVIPSIKGAPSTLSRELDGQLTTAGTKAGSTFGETAGKSAATKFKERFTSLLRTGIIIGGAFAAYQGVRLIGDTISAASDLNETLNLTRVIFGRNSDAAIKWGRNAAESLGLSEDAALQARGQLADMFQQIDIGDQRAFKLSGRLTGLAADLGSFRNLGTADVLERIQAGFRGEYDSLQLLVPSISAAAVQTKAMEMFGVDNAQALTIQQKTLATVAFLYDKTGKAQGDFGRTSHGLANSSKILGAELDNVQAEIGHALLPIAKDFVNLIRDEGVPALRDFSGWFKTEGLPALKDGAQFVGELGDELKPVAENLLPVLVDVGQDASAMLLGMAGGLKSVAGFFASLPPDVQRLAFEVGIAAAAYGRFNKAVATSSLINWSKGLADAETRTLRLQGALRTVSGTAGLLAFAQGIGEADSVTSTFETTIGGALTGFGVGGPWGAAIGGGIGLLTGLGKAFLFSGDSADSATPQVADYISTLSGLTGAATRGTRTLIAQTLEDAGQLKEAAKFGISGGSLVDAVIGSPAKLREVESTLSTALSQSETRADHASAALTRYQDVLANQATPATDAQAAHEHQLWLAMLQTSGRVILQKKAIEGLTGSLEANRDKLHADAAEQRRVAAASTGNVINMQKYRDALKEIPPEARTQIRLLGTDVSKADLKTINSEFKGFSGKNFQAFVKIFGLDDANRQLQQTDSWLDTIDGRVAQSRVINTVIDRHLVQAPGSAAGGPISGPGTATSDTAGLYRLSNGEYVEPADVVSYYGQGFFDALRAKAIPKADGGGISSGPSSTPTGTNDALVRALIGEIRAMRRGLPVQITNADALDGRSRRVARDEIAGDRAFRVSHHRQTVGVS